MELADRVFVVTGAGNGIGREVVLGLLERGAQVAAVDNSEAGLSATGILAGPASGLSVHHLDVSDRAAVLALPEAVIRAHGQVDGLLNVAGIIQPFVQIDKLDFADIEHVMNVNFWGVVNTTKAFLPHLLARPAASILNVSSMAGFLPVPGQGAYGASKAAVKLFTEALYAETLGTTLAVTVVFPGAVGTGIAANSGVDVPRLKDPSARLPKMTSPAQAGRQVIEALRNGKYRVRIGSDVTFMDRFSRLAPQRATAFLAKNMKSLLG